MTPSDPETRYHAPQAAMRECPSCHSLFTVKRPSQSFCGPRCRSAFHTDTGATGKVASVRRIGRGASIVIHLSGPAAEAALQLTLGKPVRIVPSFDPYQKGA